MFHVGDIIKDIPFNRTGIVLRVEVNETGIWYGIPNDDHVWPWWVPADQAELVA